MQKLRFLRPFVSHTTFHPIRRSCGLVGLQQLRLFHASTTSLARIQFHLADIGEGITECELIQWFVKEGSQIEQFDKICEVQSDKATVEITSRYDGKISKLHYKPGDIAKVGAPLMDIETDGADDAQTITPAEDAKSPAAPLKAATSPAPSTSAPHITDDSQILATPAVRRVARELGINLTSVKGTGRVGRIMKEDVFAFSENKESATVVIESSTTSISTNIASLPKTPVIQQLTPIQKAMVKSMTASLDIPHFGFSDTLSFESIKKVRHQINDKLEYASKGAEFQKLTFMPFIMKSFSLALQKYPILNSSFYSSGSQSESKPHLLIKPSHNISIAIDSPSGLVVPNVANVEIKSLLEISQDVYRLQELAKKGQLPPESFQNGTITISNIGNLGGKVLGPVIPPGTVCIVAIGKASVQPVYHKNAKGEWELKPEEVTTVSFAADHRVIDGATVAKFFLEWKNLLENPGLMLLNLK